MSVDDAKFDWSKPAARGEVANRRAGELRRRRMELARGQAVTSTAVDLARARAHQAVDRAEQAERAALHRHVEAWRAHMRASAVYEQAALASNDADCDAKQTAAERHRLNAVKHQREVERLTSRPWPDVL